METKANMKLKGVMASRGYSIKRLAGAIGVNYNTLQRKISGNANFTLVEANQISKALNMTLDEAYAAFLDPET